MKKVWALCLCGVMLFSLGGCKEKNETSDPSTEQSNAGESTPVSRKLGLGTVTTVTASDKKDKNRVKATVAAVVVGADGKIADCEVDELAFDVTLQNGLAQQVADLMSKGEMGDRYRPTADEMGGKQNSDSWEDQVEAFCDFVEGKTGAQVSAVAATDGKTEQIPGCDLVVTDFIQAVRQAADAATDHKIGGGDDLHLALTASQSDSAEGTKPRFDVEIAALTLDAGDRITACITDTLEVGLTVSEGVFATVAGVVQTKREMKESYGMKEASPIKKEWYQQADAFSAWAVGKTADGLAGLELKDGKTDAISGCTIAVGGMLKNAVKAARED